MQTAEQILVFKHFYFLQYINKQQVVQTNNWTHT